MILNEINQLLEVLLNIDDYEMHLNFDLDQSKRKNSTRNQYENYLILDDHQINLFNY